jgi:hypothetical protein
MILIWAWRPLVKLNRRTTMKKVFGRLYFSRTRVALRRYGVQRGRTFNAVHIGKRSYYFQHNGEAA